MASKRFWVKAGERGLDVGKPMTDCGSLQITNSTEKDSARSKCPEESSFCGFC